MGKRGFFGRGKRTLPSPRKLPEQTFMCGSTLLEANDSINHEKTYFLSLAGKRWQVAPQGTFYGILLAATTARSEKIPEKGVSKINPSTPPPELVLLSDPVWRSWFPADGDDGDQIVPSSGGKRFSFPFIPRQSWFLYSTGGWWICAVSCWCRWQSRWVYCRCADIAVVTCTAAVVWK